jgi:separase
MLQSLRLWNRATDALIRLSAPVAKSSVKPEDTNPFEAPKDPSPSEQPSGSPKELESSSKTYSRRPAMNGLEWRVSEGLLMTLFAIGQVYLNRGSSREAEYFVQQAQDLAQSLNAPTMVSRALAKKGEIQLYQHQFEASLENLTKAAELVQNTPGVDHFDIQRLQGIYNERIAMQDDACEIYEGTMNMIEQLNEAFQEFDSLTSGYVYPGRRFET